MDNRTYIWGIPDIIFSGILSTILGAAIALLGTWLQGRKQAKLQTEQLTHDARERAREREMALRRDVYLPAAEGIAKLQEYLKSYSSLSMSSLEREEIIRNVWGGFNKIAIVASIDTIEVFDGLYLKFSELNGPLSLKYLNIYRIDQEADEIRNNQKQVLSQLEQNWNVLNSGVLTGKPPQLEALGQEINSQQETIRTQFDAIKEKRLEVNRLRFEMVEEIGNAVAEIEKIMVAANIRIRNEMNFPIDEERYLASVSKTYELMQQSARQTITEFEKQVPEAFASFEKKSD